MSWDRGRIGTVLAVVGITAMVAGMGFHHLLRDKKPATVFDSSKVKVVTYTRPPAPVEEVVGDEDCPPVYVCNNADSTLNNPRCCKSDAETRVVAELAPAATERPAARPVRVRAPVLKAPAPRKDPRRVKKKRQRHAEGSHPDPPKSTFKWPWE